MIFKKILNFKKKVDLVVIFMQIIDFVLKYLYEKFIF